MAYEAEHRTVERLIIELRNRNTLLTDKPLKPALLMCITPGASADALEDAADLYTQNFTFSHFRDWHDGSACSTLMWRALHELATHLREITAM